MPRYDLGHERRGGRCAWCWEAIDTTDSHAVVRSLAPPPLELRFHHKCWAVYRGLSGIEGAELKALYREWTPARVEALRLHAGLNLRQLAAKLRVSHDWLMQYLSGQGRLGRKPVARLRGLAVDTHFERQEQGGGVIDWSDRRAVFCLCMHCQWTAGDLGRRVGVRANTVTAWWDKGCSKQSVRHWHRLTALARGNRFDAGMLVDDYLWTRELARQVVELSGLSQTAFAGVAGCLVSVIRAGVRGNRRINRPMAYFFTRAAVQLRLPLPPKGRIEPKHRAGRPFPGGHKGPQGDRVWKPEELALLGTMPDRQVATQMATRSYIAVMHMRKGLGIPKVPQLGWDGMPRPCAVALPEVLRRYYARLGMEPPAS